MKLARDLVAGLCVLAAGVLAAPAAQGAGPLKVLLLSGANNHNWKATTPALKKILEDSKRFVVTVTNDPSASLAEPALGQYDVIVSNWAGFPKMTARQWGPKGEKAFLEFIRAGKGFALFHAACASFHTWPEFQQISGATWGKRTGHGRQHAFDVTVTDPNHPITQGMKAFRTTDELWHRMQAHPDRHVLCTAFSAKNQGGSGQAEPVAFTTKLGKGRGFNLVLGHGVPHMQTVPWMTLMLRGTEWAATGKVTVPIPANWPTAAGGASGNTTAGGDVNALLKKTAAFKFGDSHEDLIAVEKLVWASSANPAARAKLADAMARMLDSTATGDCKKWLLGQLSLIGGARQVPAMARLLNDETFRVRARFALARVPGDESPAAMRAMLDTAKGPALAGLITTLGVRRDAGSIDAVARRMGSADPVVAAAALYALGQIGGSAGARVLAEARVPPALKPALADALLRCAVGLLDAGQGAQAEGIFKRLSGPDQPAHIRTAAFPGLVACQKGRGVELLTGALTGKDRALQSAAIRCARSTSGAELTKILAAQVPNLPAEVQVQLIDALGDRGDTAALAAVTAATSDKMPPAVQLAAIAAMGKLGTTRSVGILAGCAARDTGPQRRVARAALVRLRGKDIDEAMIALFNQDFTGDKPGLQREMIIALRSRGVRAATPALLDLIGKDHILRVNDAVRTEAALALRELAAAEHCPAMIVALAKTTSPAVRRDLENALIATSRRTKATGRTAQAAMTAMQFANPATKGSLLRVLANFGGARSLAVVRAAIKDPNPDVRAGAIRALAEWPDGAALDDLLAAARDAKDLTVKVLALRGFAALAPRATDRKPDDMGTLLALALKIAPRPDEKKMLLSALGQVHSPQALQLAVGMMGDAAVADEAALAAVQVAEAIWRYEQDATKPVVRKILATAKSADVKSRASAIMLAMSKPVNIAIGAAASSPDGLEKDGASGGDQAAIDGNPATYWDEADGGKLYVLRITLKAATNVSAVNIIAYAHHNYSPKDFQILCDGKVVKTVRNAKYDNARLIVAFTQVRCKTVELKITGCYGQSPAIRELEIYNVDPSGKDGR